MMVAVSAWRLAELLDSEAVQNVKHNNEDAAKNDGGFNLGKNIVDSSSDLPHT